MKEKYALVNLETGEIIERIKSYRTEEQDEAYKNKVKSLNGGLVQLKTIEPFVRISKNQIIDERVDRLSIKDQARLYKLIRLINTKNRIMYGESPNMVCKTWEDLIKIKELNLTARSLKDFRQALMREDVIREITTNHGKKYIVFNPLFVVNGKYLDPVIFIFFKDVIKEYELISEEDFEKMEEMTMTTTCWEVEGDE